MLTYFPPRHVNTSSLCQNIIQNCASTMRDSYIASCSSYFCVVCGNQNQFLSQMETSRSKHFTFLNDYQSFTSTVILTLSPPSFLDKHYNIFCFSQQLKSVAIDMKRSSYCFSQLQARISDCLMFWRYLFILGTIFVLSGNTV